MIPRKIVQRACVVLVLIIVSVFLFYYGKGHTLLLDTNPVTIGGKEMRSPASVTVFINGREEDPMGRGERVMVMLSGPRHKIVIADDAAPSKQVERSFAVSTFLDTAIVSIPAILGDAPPEFWVTPFTPPPLEEAPVERMHMQAE